MKQFDSLDSPKSTVWRAAQGAAAPHARGLPYRTPKDSISLHLGYPDPVVFDVERFADAMSRSLKAADRESLQYCGEYGHPGLRRELAGEYSTMRPDVDFRQVLVTHGTTEALDLISTAFLSPGDCIFMEAPTYLWAIRSFRLREAQIVNIATNEDGLDLDCLSTELERLESVRRTPKFLYIMPDFQNPTGRSMPLSNRLELLAIAARFALPIIEDTPYRELRYDGENVPTLFDLDQSNLVIQARSFSKTIAPGVRIGWVAGPSKALDILAQVKQTGTCTVMSAAVAHYLVSDAMIPAISTARHIYREKRDAMEAALKRHMPHGGKWSRPEGGFYTWVTLPDSVDIDELFQRATADGVLFLKGSGFYAGTAPSSELRLSFSYEPCARIEEGVSKLGSLIRSMS